MARHRGLQEWWDLLVAHLTTTDTIPHVSRKRTGRTSTSSLKQSSVKNVANSKTGGQPLKRKSAPKPRVKSSQVAPEDDDNATSSQGIQSQSSTGEAPPSTLAAAELKDVNMSFLDISSLDTDDAVLRRYMSRFTFRFRNRRTEEHYFRTQLLPNRVLHLRLLAFLQLLQYSGIMFPTYRAYDWFNSPNVERFPPGYIIHWTCSGLVWLFILYATLWRKGNMYIMLCLRSRKWRTFLTIIETLAVVTNGVWDYYLAPTTHDAVGAISTTPLLYFAAASGFASTYIQGVFGLLLVMGLCVGKLALVAYWRGEHHALVYALPLVAAIIISNGLLIAGDKRRRIGYIKYQVVEDRLAQMRLERMKTDYLLSLSLPKPIVAKLRESGLGSLDLIAERFPQATVMFCDLKNFKEVTSTLGSTKEALTLLNGIFQHVDEAIEEFNDLSKIKTISTKILLVGGLQSTLSHLRQMVELAIGLREYFSVPQIYDVGGTRLNIKLDIAFGIATGPLVAGIVGRKKFVYEIYGDVVNTASRMCSLASEQEIIITEGAQRQLRNVFDLQPLGPKYVKGKGEIPVFSVTGFTEHPDGVISPPRRFSRKSSITTGEGPTSRLGSLVTSAFIKTPLTTEMVEDSVSGQLPTVSEEGGPEECRSVLSFAQPQSLTGASKILLDRYLSIGSGGLGLGGGMESHQPAKAAMGVAKLGSPLTLAKTTRTNIAHVDREFGGFNNPPKAQAERKNSARSGSRGGGEAGETTNVLAAIREASEPKAKTLAEEEDPSAPEAKEVLIDVVLRMASKIDMESATGLSYMKVVYEETDALSVRFKNALIEQRFRWDFTGDTRDKFVKIGAIILLVEILFYFMAIWNAIHSGVQLTYKKVDYYMMVGLGIASVGLQMLLTGVLVFSTTDPSPPSRNFAARTGFFCVYVFTLWVNIFSVSLPWSHLKDTHFLTSFVLPHLGVFLIMRIDGMIYLFRLIAAIVFGITLIGVQIYLRHTLWQEVACMILSGALWMVIFYLVERQQRVDYLIDLILDTQGELVAEEINKSAAVLHSILPQAVILKLLENPTSIVYEEMEMVTVLHMDIVGFTAMSSQLEPLTIVKMLNTLFTFFDHLTEEYAVEKITTIGDAYVACSSFAPDADHKTGALSICLVALQMQAYVDHQLNTSQIVMQIIKSPLKMRIGIHTGPASGAIMGGPKNFRYDVLGDTVTFAEKTQELCPTGQVSITQVTYSLVRDYHGFSFLCQIPSKAIPSHLRTYTLLAADERIVNHTGTDCDAPPPPPPSAPPLQRMRSLSAASRTSAPGAFSNSALRTGPVATLGVPGGPRRAGSFVVPSTSRAAATASPLTDMRKSVPLQAPPPVLPILTTSMPSSEIPQTPTEEPTQSIPRASSFVRDFLRVTDKKKADGSKI
ncbi:hypothetical protein DFS34DRAFT_646691 [Phlyctochytrium arcticum]|nr:hypothetical protein DFS34DRAFT_646691 [Phlyctochytrium arcticum]